MLRFFLLQLNLIGDAYYIICYNIMSQDGSNTPLPNYRPFTAGIGERYFTPTQIRMLNHTKETLSALSYFMTWRGPEDPSQFVQDLRTKLQDIVALIDLRVEYSLNQDIPSDVALARAVLSTWKDSPAKSLYLTQLPVFDVEPVSFSWKRTGPAHIPSWHVDLPARHGADALSVVGPSKKHIENFIYMYLLHNICITNGTDFSEAPYTVALMPYINHITSDSKLDLFTLPNLHTST
jgi:hypothetical protein